MAAKVTLSIFHPKQFQLADYNKHLIFLGQTTTICPLIPLILLDCKPFTPRVGNFVYENGIPCEQDMIKSLSHELRKELPEKANKKMEKSKRPHLSHTLLLDIYIECEK